MSSVPPPSDPYGRPSSRNPEQEEGSAYGSWQGQTSSGGSSSTENHYGSSFGGAWGQSSSQQGNGGWNQAPGQQGQWGHDGSQEPGNQGLAWNGGQWTQSQGQWNQQQNAWNQPQNQWNQPQDPQEQWNGGRAANGRIRWGKILTFGGGGVLLLALVALILGGVGVASSAVHASDDTVVVQSYKTRSMSLESGKTYILYHADDDPSSTCNIYGPGQIDTGVDSMQYTVTKDSRTWVSQESFAVDNSGSYDFSCSSGHDVMVGEPLDVGGLGGGVIALILGGIAAFLGFVALVVGIILWVVGSRRRRAVSGY